MIGQPLETALVHGEISTVLVGGAAEKQDVSCRGKGSGAGFQG
jgi:hypothetical protein